MGSYLGIELGSTRIKAVAVDERFIPSASGSYTWKSRFENGVWTYRLEEAWTGLRAALRGLGEIGTVHAMGVSAMMHGYLAFDADWKLLTPFRTWQNTVTGPASKALTELFQFNIPQRWSVAHLYQAVLDQEAHVPQIAHITTLAGYIHFQLTGRNVVGIGEASGIFPIDPDTLSYDQRMLDALDQALAEHELPWRVADLLPEVLTAGQDAGHLSEAGAALLDGLLPAGIPLAPPEGDADTGMTATNSVAVRSGNVSAGTSIFALVVLERPLARIHPEISVLATPNGRPAALLQCNNCTGDFNAWAALLREMLALFGAEPDGGELFTKLFQKSLEGAADCGGVTVYNYLAGEPTTGFNEGRPLVLRSPSSPFSLADFLRAQLYATLASLTVAVDILRGEDVSIDRIMAHGGFFKTPGVGQRYLAAATGSPVWLMETAGEGGPYGMALLAAYLHDGRGLSLESFLNEVVFADAVETVQEPLPEDVAGFRAYLGRFLDGLDVQRKAVELL